MTTVLYGRNKKYVDVTERYKGYIPKSDQSRTALFGGDPVPNTKKKVKVITPECTEIYEVGQYRLPDKLTDLHKKLVLKDGTFNNELDEQVMAVLYLNKGHKVLEIGADIGTNTCIIASICDTPPVVVECNSAIQDTLMHNIKSNGLTVNLEIGALSKSRLVFRFFTNTRRIGQETIKLEEGQPIPEEYEEIRTIDYDYLVQKYHKFDAVVADCEGALYYIIQDFPQILDDISILIVENDYKEKGQKDYIDKQLLDNRFIRVYHNRLVPGIRYFLHCDRFYEVWKKVDTMKVRSAGYNSHNKYSQVGDLIIRDRGLNIVYVDDNGSLTHKNFDTYSRDYTAQIIDFHSKLKNKDHFYIVVYDDAYTKLNLPMIALYFKKYGIKQIDHIQYRSAYYCAYYKGKVQERLSNTDVTGYVSLGADSNITICCSTERYKYFEDYVISISNTLHCNILVSDKLCDYKYADDMLYIFCMHLPAYKVIEYEGTFSVNSAQIQCKNKIVLNTEQLTALPYLKYYTDLTAEDIKIIDYSLFNTHILNKSTYIPYQYNEDEVNLLKEYLNVDKQYDVVLVHTYHKRRTQIVDELRKKGITVKYVYGWREGRDRELAKGRLLLNIRAYSGRIVWESMRCDRWIFAGLPVVSEISIDCADLDIRSYVHWSSYEGLVDKVKEVLDDIKNEQYAPRVVSNDIIENRKQLLSKFKSTVSQI